MENLECVALAKSNTTDTLVKSNKVRVKTNAQLTKESDRLMALKTPGVAAQSRGGTIIRSMRPEWILLATQVQTINHAQ